MDFTTEDAKDTEKKGGGGLITASIQTPSTQQMLDDFARTTDEIVSLAELRRLLEAGRQIRIKYGVDVTAPYLHIGHAVNLWMMRRLQDRGHKILLLIGDFTTRIGDPTGSNKTRPVIPAAEIAANAEQLIAQAGMVLRTDDPNLLEIRRNSEWYRRMSAGEILDLLSMVTHTRLAARDMFQERIQSGAEIYMHELIYPILQGYDSFALQSDLTIIGSDQLYNEMLGRFYQERLGQQPQVIVTTKITPGLDGKAKQSKSLGNYIGLGHSPRDKYGRAMTLPDRLIAEYLRVYTDMPLEEIDRIEARTGREPLACKYMLAHAIVARYHGTAVADTEQRWFQETFSARQTPADIPEMAVAGPSHTPLELVRRFFAGRRSNSALRRLFQQGAVSLDGQSVARPDQLLDLRDGAVFQVGKRTWFRVRLDQPEAGERMERPAD